MAFPQDALAVKVELFYDSVWNDITSYVYTEDDLEITRGRPNETSTVDPSRATFLLDNTDGRFSPRNPLSPLYGTIGRNTPVRISVGTSFRFHGQITAWPQQWSIIGTDVRVPVEAAGILRQLGQGASPLRTAPYRYVAAQDPVAYWPCDDGPSARTAAPAAGGKSMMLSKFDVATAQVATIGADKVAPWLDTGITLGQATAPVSMDAGPWAVDAAFGYDPDNAHFDLVAKWIDNSNFLRDFQLIVAVEETDQLSLYADGGFTLLHGEPAPDLFDDTTEFHVFRIAASQSGADIAWTVYVDGVSRFSGTRSLMTLQPMSEVSVFSGLDVTVVAGHVVVWGGSKTIESAAHVSDAMFGNPGEAAGTRISRLCTEEGITFSSTGTLADSYGCGPQYPDTLLTILQDAADADLGILYEPRDSLGLAYRTRASLYNQTATLAVDYTGEVLGSVPQPVDDDQATRNDVTVERRDGSSYHATINEGPLSTQDPPNGAGRYDEQITVNVAGDGKMLEDQAGWRLHLGTVDEARYPIIDFDLAQYGFTSSATLTDAAKVLDLGDRVTISNPPSWLPPDLISQLVQGFTELITDDAHGWRIVVNCVPERPFRVATYESGAGSSVNKYGTAGSSLAAAFVAGTDTSMSVSVDVLPLWTTDANEIPLEIECGGARLTVSAISGTSSPQTFTVSTTVVNGVAKTIPAGTAVRLWQTPILAL
jgi:hypothetical protein